MRRSLLLDADVVIDLHTLGLFEKISNAYDICLTRDVFFEAKYYKKDGEKFDLEIKYVVIIQNIDLEILREVRREAKEEKLEIGRGKVFRQITI